MGREDPDAMLSRMPLPVWLGWCAYREVHGPFGETRMDLHFARLMALVASMGGNKATVEEFLLDSERNNPEVQERLSTARLKAAAWQRSPECAALRRRRT